MKKRTLIIIFAILLLFGVAGIATLVFFKSSEQGMEISLPADIASWRTYRNEEMNFEIKYPPELVGLERIYSTIPAGGINFKLPIQEPSDPGELYQFYGRRYFRSGPDPCNPPPEGIHTEKVIGGVKFVRTELEQSIYYTGKYRDICYHLVFEGHFLPSMTDPDKLEQMTNRFEQIASTFKVVHTEK